MRTFSRTKLRSASIVALATAALAGTSALAAQIQTSPSPSAPGHSQATAHPSESPDLHRSPTPHPSPSQSAAAKPTPSAKATESPETGDSGIHGACVSKVAQDHTAVADNGHGKKTHGAAVSKAAHDCPKG
jgi:hypothetical protein